MKQQPPCDDKSSLMAYLYDECDADERRLVERHLAQCTDCAAELGQLRAVRGVLREWAPPEQALGFRVVREEAKLVRPSRWWNRGGLGAPAWAQLAAAVVLLASGAAIGNLAMRRDAASPADLARLELRLQQQEQQISALRTKVDRTRPATVSEPVVRTPAAAPVTLSPEQQAKLLRQVQLTMDDMGRRQQQALDQRVAEWVVRFQHDVDTQRIADQTRFVQGFKQIDLRMNQVTSQQNNLVRYVTQEIK